MLGVLAECKRLLDLPDLRSDKYRLRDDIERLHYSSLDVSALARVCMSPRHMNRQFKARFGLTPARNSPRSAQCA